MQPILPPLIPTCGLCKQALEKCHCGTTPARPATRFVKRGAYLVCEVCQLTSMYCRGHAASQETAANDGAHSSLSQRIRQHRGGR